MRFVGLLLAAFAFVQQAQAADLGGVLRGAMVEGGAPRLCALERRLFWRPARLFERRHGLYQGAELQVSFILSETALQNNSNVSNLGVMGVEGTSRPTYGAFVGYNLQWDNAIVGVEFNYNHVNTG